jgi:hypothetical protein
MKTLKGALMPCLRAVLVLMSVSLSIYLYLLYELVSDLSFTKMFKGEYLM